MYILLICDEVFSRIWIWILFLDTWNNTPVAATILIRFLIFLNGKHFPLQTDKQQLEEIG